VSSCLSPQLQATELHELELHELELHELELHEFELQYMPLHDVELHELLDQPLFSEMSDDHVVEDHEVDDHDVDDHEVESQGAPRTSCSPVTRSGWPSWFRSTWTWNLPRLPSSEPAPSERTNPVFAQSPAPMLWSAPAASTSPDPPPDRYWEARNVLPIRMLFTEPGRRDGFAW
jgi:hypothetical protein